MIGKIIKGISGFYYVYCKDENLYECKAKGIFRKNNNKPLVGDNCKISIIDEINKIGNIDEILERKNQLIRPSVANVDQGAIVISTVSPRPNFPLIDKFLILMEQNNIPCFLIINKIDLEKEDIYEKWIEAYRNTGMTVVPICAVNKEGNKLLEIFKDKTTVLAGASGVGKSTITNLLQKNVEMETGEISKKLKRGKHTTRHVQIIPLEAGGYIVDTPGFTSLDLFNIEKEDLKSFYPEFSKLEEQCRFNMCTHIHEPDCKVKEEVENNRTYEIRYNNYKTLFEELKEKRKY